MRTAQEESYARRVDWDHWRKLFRYTLNYKRDVRLLALCAVGTGASEVLLPLVTRGLIDDVNSNTGESVRILGYGAVYTGLVLTLAACVLVGTLLGSRLLDRVSESRFRALYRGVLTLVALRLVVGALG